MFGEVVFSVFTKKKKKTTVFRANRHAKSIGENDRFYG